jgi:diguanylate cyclase (GGDEF)-like protein
MAKTQKKQRSLYAQVLSLVFIPSAFLIIAFITIELAREAQIVTSEYSTRIRLSTLFLHEKLELVKDQNATDLNLLDKIKEFSAPLQKNGLINQYAVLDSQSKPVLAVPPGALSEPDDINRIQQIVTAEQFTKEWLYTFQNKDRNQMLVYLPIYINHQIAYFYKTDFSLAKVEEILKRMYAGATATVIFVLGTAIYLTRNLIKKIIHPLKQLNVATKEIMSGNFSKTLTVESSDEIGELANTFNEMTEKLSLMKEMAENANPLTHLPGNNVIQSEIGKRIKVGAKFVVIYGDLDNFKAYNDAYGIEKGDQAIKLAAQILKEAIDKKGTTGDFLGHEGGDDFVMITSPSHTETVANYIKSEFEAKAKTLYSQEDQRKGFIVGHERRSSQETGESPLITFPLMSISLAALSNETKDFASYADITNRLVEVKHKAKTTKGNAFVLER